MELNRQVEMDARAGSSSPWGWIAGAVFLVVLLALVFTSGGDGTRTAGTDTSPPATTGMAPKAIPPAMTPPAGTTGQVR
jgi:hypothetical protein